jgi:hypothetical protein
MDTLYKNLGKRLSRNEMKNIKGGTIYSFYSVFCVTPPPCLSVSTCYRTPVMCIAPSPYTLLCISGECYVDLE